MYCAIERLGEKGVGLKDGMIMAVVGCQVFLPWGACVVGRPVWFAVYLPDKYSAGITKDLSPVDVFQALVLLCGLPSEHNAHFAHQTMGRSTALSKHFYSATFMRPIQDSVVHDTTQWTQWLMSGEVPAGNLDCRRCYSFSSQLVLDFSSRTSNPSTWLCLP